MTQGVGKYDHEARDLRTTTGASGVVVAVLDGKRGSGCSVHASRSALIVLAGALREIADDMERDAALLPDDGDEGNAR